MYLLSTSMISRIPNKPTSIERDIFPVMADEGELYELELPGYWMDIGQPKDYVSAQQMYIRSLDEK